MRRRLLLTAPALLAVRPARAAGVLRVAYAGSMGVVMDRVLGPEFGAANAVAFQGTGQGAFGLARLLAAKTLQADVFVSVTPGPIRLLEAAGLVKDAVPIASTAMVIAYSPRSRFAPALKAAASPWWEVLRSPGLRFGRTDPITDPQGRNIIFTMQLAERYYRAPGFARAVLGADGNPAQIFTEPSLLSRLESGQIDASSGYQSAVAAHHLPYVALPPEINLSDPAYDAAWYSKAAITLPQPGGGTKDVYPEPLVFYAALLEDAPSPELGRRFVAFLTSDPGQERLREGGYGPPKGGSIA
ncbi:MAG: extracellular solute-binding protein [Acetobacteraceae bacterium]